MVTKRIHMRYIYILSKNINNQALKPFVALLSTELQPHVPIILLMALEGSALQEFPDKNPHDILFVSPKPKVTAYYCFVRKVHWLSFPCKHSKLFSRDSTCLSYTGVHAWSMPGFIVCLVHEHCHLWALPSTCCELA